jgi:4-hydroxy-3-methylbut-2-enyl diphosphate reductase
VIGTVGYYPARPDCTIVVVENEEEARAVSVPDPQRVAYASQTTLAVDGVERIVRVLRERFPKLAAPHRDDICYATQNRQDAVRMLCAHATIVIVIGAPHSSNTVRMVEVARELGVAAHLIQTAHEIEPDWLEGVHHAGLTSSASAPERLVDDAISRVRALVPDVKVMALGTAEDIVFKLPVEVTRLRTRSAQPADRTSTAH